MVALSDKLCPGMGQPASLGETTGDPDAAASEDLASPGLAWEFLNP